MMRIRITLVFCVRTFGQAFMMNTYYYFLIVSFLIAYFNDLVDYCLVNKIDIVLIFEGL
jgi:hypothetical protein